MNPHTKFEAEAYILTKEEGGRHTPFFANYRPQFYFRTTDVTGTVTLAEGTEMVMPGDNVSFTVELIAPIAMEEKLRFRHPRRRPHRRRRRGLENHRVMVRRAEARYKTRVGFDPAHPTVRRGGAWFASHSQARKANNGNAARTSGSG